MSIESYLVARLTADATLVALLAAWAPPGGPAYTAIFQNTAPSDADPGWVNGVQYPRITFQVDRTLTVEQTLQGTLHLQVWTRDSDTASLRAIQNAVMAEVNSLALLTDEGLVECTFRTATPFRQVDDAKIIGVDLAFDVSAYVSQTTFPPDPIKALAGFVHVHLDPAITVLPTPNAATDSAPLLYWRLVGDQVQPRDLQAWGEWHTVTVRGHVLAPGAYARLNWARLVARNLVALPSRRLALDDGSALRVRSVRVDQTASPTSQGQIVFEGTYGILARQPTTTFVSPPIDPITGTSGSGSGSGGSTGGGSAPPPPIPPPVIGPPVYTPQRPVVSPGDTGELLARLHVIVRDPDETGTAPETLTLQTTAPTETVTL